MLKKIHGIKIAVFIFLVLLLGFSVYFMQVFIKHERAQNAAIKQLEGEVSYLKALGDRNGEGDSFSAKCQKNFEGGGYNYLAIGNSITRHDYAEYWWSDCGVAASEPDKDYFHIVSKDLQGRGSTVSCAFQFIPWELQDTDRAETFILLEPYLNEGLNLVTIQLGENVKNLNTFQTDMEELIHYIQNRAPKAQIIVVGDFWSGERSKIQRAAAMNCNAAFVDLDGLHGKEEYQTGLGAFVLGDDGIEHEITHDGVAIHPNDKGMEYIADGIIREIK